MGEFTPTWWRPVPVRTEGDPNVVADAELAHVVHASWIVEEKLDGPNAALSFDSAGEL